jgi:hypothetical protein
MKETPPKHLNTEYKRYYEELKEQLKEREEWCIKKRWESPFARAARPINKSSSR